MKYTRNRGQADEGPVVVAGRLPAQTLEAGLSLGDRFCLARALREGLPAMTKDQQIDELKVKGTILEMECGR